MSRTNSDSALHQSAMNPKPQDVFAGGSQELQPKRGNGTFSLRGLKAFCLGFLFDLISLTCLENMNVANPTGHKTKIDAVIK